MKFYSQLGQDRFLLENFFRGKRGGVFVDIGAYDGETYSNTLFFERFMGWSGLCVEPLPSAFAKLKAARRAICERVCIADFEGEAEFEESDSGPDEKMLSGLTGHYDARHVRRIEGVATNRRRMQVPVTRLATLLERHCLRRVDYCSIDTEGAELAILADLDLERFPISLLTVENNYDDERIPALMTQKGYVFAAKIEQDYIFRRPGVKLLPRVSVICAVPQALPDRDRHLREAAESLARQTVPVEAIFVFERGETPPAWLTGQAARSGGPLSRYQAWNLGLSLVSTSFAMTFELTDRLAPDAVEQLYRALDASDAVAIHGAWRLAAGDGEPAKAPEACIPAPLVPGERLAEPVNLLWRMEAHLRAPRYPWRLRDGSLLGAGAEEVWCSLLSSGGRAKIVHLPMVVGLRLQPQMPGLTPEERALLMDPGVSLL